MKQTFLLALLSGSAFAQTCTMGAGFQASQWPGQDANGSFVGAPIEVCTYDPPPARYQGPPLPPPIDPPGPWVPPVPPPHSVPEINPAGFLQAAALIAGTIACMRGKKAR